MDWIDSNLRSSRLSVLINGSQKGYFHCFIGVRQGDPLSPLMFGITEDFLSRLLSRMVDLSQLLPISSPREFSTPTHLLYADDVPIFYRGIVLHMKNIMHAFEVYGNISGQLVNWALTWHRLLNQLPTEDRLCRAGFHLASQCSVCGVSSDSSDHLFLLCLMAAALWEAIFSAFQLRNSANSWSSFFSQAMLVSFIDHVRVLWKITIHVVVWSVLFARNQWIFKSKAVDFRSTLSLVWRAVFDANRLEIGCMLNCVDYLLILHLFDLCSRPTRAPIIKSVIWSSPAPGRIKVNTDGAALSSPGVGGCSSWSDVLLLLRASSLADSVGLATMYLSSIENGVSGLP
ncbi:hypothetical protein Dsin_005674 [Dipteronia sinensis]|uniref:Reverse transcriptase zinc-binding domain-containing protein n=1 Tax=Dipteronia sinensis TaxID=43782 RepID=A0AAE0AXA4_9ROSI|nr:hypothetical protein Dsin_005674 [Dipteronia sinensis]